MDWLLMLYVTLGALVGFAVRIAVGTLVERGRSYIGHQIADHVAAVVRDLERVEGQLRMVESVLTQMQQLVKASAPAALVDLGERVSKLEARDVQLHLQVMDQAEKVSRRLNDRERKRREVQDALTDDDPLPLHDRDLLFAEAKRQYPLFPGDVAPEPAIAGEPE